MSRTIVLNPRHREAVHRAYQETKHLIHINPRQVRKGSRKQEAIQWFLFFFILTLALALVLAVGALRNEGAP